MTLQNKALIINDEIKSAFGGNTTLVDIKTNQADPLVNLVTTLLAGQLRVEDKLKFLETGLFPSDVEGEYLTLVAQMMGSDRRLNQPSKAPIIVVGKAGVVLPAETILIDNKGNEWKTTTDAVIQECFAYTNACSPTGRYDLKNGELKLKDAVNNIKKATNAAAPTLGGLYESDESLRNRLLSKRPQWQNKGTKNALIWQLEQLNDVLRVRIINELPDCFNLNCNDPDFVFKRFMIAVLGGADEEVAQTIFEHLCFSTDRLVGNTAIEVRCDTVRFQRMCPILVEVKYWFKCDCIDPIANENIKQIIADRLNETSLSQHSWGVNDLCKISKDLIKIQFRIIKQPLLPDDCPCDITYNNPITGAENERYCIDDPNSHCLISSCDTEEFTDCIILQPWWYPVFLPENITQGVGCPCPKPDDACGCALDG